VIAQTLSAIFKRARKYGGVPIGISQNVEDLPRISVILLFGKERIAYSCRKYRFISNNKAVIWAINKESLLSSGFYDLATA